MNVPDSVSTAVRPLFERLPLSEAMGDLVPDSGAAEDLLSLVQQVVAEPGISNNLPLVSALWLYVDELDRSHTVSQGIENATGSFWHGIMHRREGDFGNSHYWFNKVGHHPAMAAMPDYDGHGFVDEAQARHAENPLDLVEKQRTEWAVLFEWCANEGQ
jgi:hypothetical protein